MKEFEELKNLWSGVHSESQVDVRKLVHRKESLTGYLKKQYKYSAIGIYGVVLYMVWFGFLSDRELTSSISYISLIIMILCLFTLASHNLSNFFHLNKTDDVQLPKEHLHQLISFHQKRYKFIRTYIPILLTLITIAFSLYLPEILGAYPTTGYKIGFLVFLLIVLTFVYFLIGKKESEKERSTLQELDQTVRALNEEESQ